MTGNKNSYIAGLPVPLGSSAGQIFCLAFFALSEDDAFCNVAVVGRKYIIAPKTGCHSSAFKLLKFHLHHWKSASFICLAPYIRPLIFGFSTRVSGAGGRMFNA